MEILAGDRVAFTWVAPEGRLAAGDLVRAVDAFAKGLPSRNGELVGGSAPGLWPSTGPSWTPPWLPLAMSESTGSSTGGWPGTSEVEEWGIAVVAATRCLGAGRVGVRRLPPSTAERGCLMIKATLPVAAVGSTLLAPVCEHCGMVHAFYSIETVKGTLSTCHPVRPMSLDELREATGGIPLRDFADQVGARWVAAAAGRGGGSMTQMFGPESCPGFNGCDAPLCPLDPPTLSGGEWFPDEEICSSRAFGSTPWIRKQRKIQRLLGSLGPEAGFFTVAMLRAIQIVRPALRGVNPDGQQTEGGWLSGRIASKGGGATFAEKSNRAAPASQGHLWGDDGPPK